MNSIVLTHIVVKKICILTKMLGIFEINSHIWLSSLVGCNFVIQVYAIHVSLLNTTNIIYISKSIDSLIPVSFRFLS